ncbi:MAG: YeeE/YedE family protein [Tateyamaria sp.]|jgi:uncharacterized protein|nr:YeeE/YedE family protein [Tateyamaria sp.]
MSSEQSLHGSKTSAPYVWRSVLILIATSIVLMIAIFVGARYGLLFAVGLGFGIVLEALGFGFAGPWRAMILKRNPAGVLAQLLSIGLVATLALPLLETHGSELSGARGSIGWAMVAGAFIFGVAMQVVLGCGSGTLVNAGSGNPIGLLALPFFAIGSFLGAYHVIWWTDLGSLPVIVLAGWSGLFLTIVMLAIVAAIFYYFANPQYRKIPKNYLIAAAIIAILAVLNLIIAGQPWGVVYGLGLWVAKMAVASGADLSGSVFFSAPINSERLKESILTDYTSLTNIGLMVGAYFVASWRIKGFSQKIPRLPLRAWSATILAGLVMGYAARLAFGCNVGAYFSGISTGSLHGWAWFAAAFCGSYYGVKLRPLLGLEAKS